MFACVLCTDIFCMRLHIFTHSAKPLDVPRHQYLDVIGIVLAPCARIKDLLSIGPTIIVGDACSHNAMRGIVGDGVKVPQERYGNFLGSAVRYDLASTCDPTIDPNDNIPNCSIASLTMAA